MSELLPCPFCGSEAESSIAYTASMISCKNEKCIMIDCLIDNEPWVDEIEKKWNEQFSIKEIEELKSLINYITPYVKENVGNEFMSNRLKEWLEKAEKIK